MSDAKDKIRNILKDAGIVPTKQRMSIANLLFSKHQHISAEQLRYQINKIDKNISRATVYNTLSLFSEKELLNKVVTETNHIFYDTNLSKHYHLYDTISGELQDIDKSHVNVSLSGLSDDSLSIEDVVVRVRRTQSS
ncbi:MAG: transcriptional repressor [Pseudomonadota bacterium]|jgi:Fur family iron response transcriptional regulator